ncbi:MAG: transposase, partial [Actinomycetota bacterium]
MSARQRESVERSAASDSKMTYTEFLRRFPDSDACLDYLKAKFYPDGTSCPQCAKPSRFHRIKGRSAYSCQFCGHHVYPTAGTIFHKSTTSLQLWFWAVYLVSSSRCGISAKQLGREIGVTYKTAWRMLNLIRNQLMDQDGEAPLAGEVEVDETYYGGKPRASDFARIPMTAFRHSEITRLGRAKKIGVFGAVERHGRVRAVVIPNANAESLKGHV